MQARLDTILGVLDSFNSVQGEIECIDQDPQSQQTHASERDAFESKYFRQIAQARRLLTATPSPLSEQGTDPVSNASNSSKIEVKLPQIHLPEFSGAYDKWTQYKETFEALISKNQSLSKVQKFYYLQASLKNEAAQVISSLTISEANYDIAWQLLSERYDNKKAIINAHIKGIFDLPTVTRESHTQLRKFLDGFLKHYRALGILDETVKYWDTILLHILSSKLDSNSKREWETLLRNNASPKIEDFSKHIAQRCQVLESLDPSTISIKKPECRTLVHLSSNKIVCPICSASHFIHACKKFIELPINERCNEVKKQKLCNNCLRGGHYTRDCKSQHTCKICKQKHNTLLHFTRQQEEKEATNSKPTQKEDATDQEKTTNCGFIMENNEVLLSTAIVDLLSKDGKQ